MRRVSTRGGATWGAVQAGDGILVARLCHEKGGRQRRGGASGLCHFECQEGSVVSGFTVPQNQADSDADSLASQNHTNVPHKAGLTQDEPWVVGLSATRMALRRARLPFLRGDQIRAVLPQESVDILVKRLEQPCFAFHAVPDPSGEGSQVFFAVCETRLLTAFIEGLLGMKVQPVGVVVAELGAWPLLEQAGLIATRGSVLIVDATLDPPAIIHLVDGQLQALRLVTPATVAAGAEAVREELLWLLDAMLRSQVVPHRENEKPSQVVPHRESEEQNDIAVATVEGEKNVIFLGRSQAFWKPFLGNPVWKSLSKEFSIEKTDAEGGGWVPELRELGQGLHGWAWVRSAGLALAARQGQTRLLDFHGVGGFYGIMREWLDFWRVAGVLFVLLAILWGGMAGLRYHLAQTRNLYFTSETKVVFHKTLPRVPVMLDPRLQLRQALAQAAPEGGQTLKMVTWLRSIQTQVDAESAVQWLRFRYEPGEVQLLGEVPSYKHLDRVQTALKSIPFVQEVRTEEAHIVTKTKKVQFRLRLL